MDIIIIRMLLVLYQLVSCVNSYPSPAGNVARLSGDCEWNDMPRVDQISSDDLSMTSCPLVCRCAPTVADCSGNNGSLTFIPALPNGISCLIFAYNNLTTIYNESFFSNITNITSLDLSHNNLMFVGNGAFTTLTMLKTLILDYNTISSVILKTVLSVRTLEYISMNFSHVRTLLPGLFCQDLYPHLEYISLTGNYLKVLNMSVFAQCTHLRKLVLSECMVTWFILNTMHSLETLIVSNNAISVFPDTCQNNTSLFQNLTELDLSGNDLSSIPTVCLPSLRILRLSYNRFERIQEFTFGNHQFPRLVELAMENMIGQGRRVSIDENAFSNPTVKIISLAESSLLFRLDKRVHGRAFASCPALEELRLNANIFRGVSDLKFYQLFGHLPSLKKLDISDSSIDSITERTFTAVPHIEQLILSGNSLTNIPDGAFDNITNLIKLLMGDNKISSIKETTFNATTRSRLRQLNLTGNPFTCSCDVMWFRQWLTSNVTQFCESSVGYNCYNIPNTSLAAFYLPGQACLFSDVFSQSIIMVCSVLIAIIFIAVFYHLRWHIRLIVYELLRNRNKPRYTHPGASNFLYDVYVSYDDYDQLWVLEHLLPELESRLGLRLCVRARDFIVSDNFVFNVVRNLERSKKVMMIFSAHFACSSLCQFELSMGILHAMDYDDVLVVVCLSDLTDHMLTTSMTAVLKTTTSIQWRYEDDVRASFRRGLRNAFKNILHK